MKYFTSNCLGLLVWGSHADTMSVLDWLEQWPKSPWLQAQVPPDSLLSYTYVYKCVTYIFVPLPGSLWPPISSAPSPLQGLCLYSTPGVMPPYGSLKEIVECAGGEVSTRTHTVGFCVHAYSSVLTNCSFTHVPTLPASDSCRGENQIREEVWETSKLIIPGCAYIWIK